MGRQARFIVVISALAGAIGCASPSEPSSSCRTNDTGTVSFQNQSNTNSTYDIVWDGSYIATISPGQTSRDFEVAAGVQHTLQFKKTNTNALACTASTPTVAQCSIHTYSCTG